MTRPEQLNSGGHVSQWSSPFSLVEQSRRLCPAEAEGAPKSLAWAAKNTVPLLPSDLTLMYYSNPMIHLNCSQNVANNCESLDVEVGPNRSYLPEQVESEGTNVGERSPKQP